MLLSVLLASIVPLAHAIPTAAVDSAPIKASFGSYDVCKSIATTCGLPPETGYTASISSNHFAIDLSSCNSCYELTAISNGDAGTPLKNAPPPMIVLIDDSCPDSTPACAPLTYEAPAEAKNSLGVNTHFDLCSDSGASQAFFGGNETSVVWSGTARKVDCKGNWKGKVWDGSAVGVELAGSVVGGS